MNSFTLSSAGLSRQAVGEVENIKRLYGKHPNPNPDIQGIRFEKLDKWCAKTHAKFFCLWLVSVPASVDKLQACKQRFMFLLTFGSAPLPLEILLQSFTSTSVQQTVQQIDGGR